MSKTPSKPFSNSDPQPLYPVADVRRTAAPAAPAPVAVVAAAHSTRKRPIAAASDDHDAPADSDPKRTPAAAATAALDHYADRTLYINDGYQQTDALFMSQWFPQFDGQPNGTQRVNCLTAAADIQGSAALTASVMTAATALNNALDSLVAHRANRLQLAAKYAYATLASTDSAYNADKRKKFDHFRQQQIAVRRSIDMLRGKAGIDRMILGADLDPTPSSVAAAAAVAALKPK